MKNNSKKNGLGRIAIGFGAGIFFALAVLVIFAGGFRNFGASEKYAAALRIIKTDYVGNYDVGSVTDMAVVGAVSALDDTWSYYMDAESYASYQNTSANVYQGIGITITKDEGTGGFLIVTITKDGPAQRAGMEAGDIILAVDGVDVTAEDTNFIRSLIQDAYGQTALIDVLRDGEELTFDVSCETVYTSPVAHELLEGRIGYVAISNFRQGAAEETIAAIEDLQEQGAESLIFDVRGDPGGQVTELTDLLDYLLPEGDIFIRIDRRGREATVTSDENCLEMPMAVIINSKSYSAAEYFAAALREYNWAVVVGESTTGKGRSQVTVELFDGSALHISKYTYLTPLRNDLYQAGGLAPDIEVGLTEEEQVLYDTGWLEPEDDPQVLAAIEVLRS